ncbi:MAG: uracil-DNA glycosylase [Rubrivivax sp.]|jgi:DNA polymerase|nr:uracil-DNA glycosylase [Rubrivivax sp.]
MPWTERQQRMLQAMGLRVWSPAAEPAEDGPPTAAAVAEPDPPMTPAPQAAMRRPPEPATAPAATPPAVAGPVAAMADDERSRHIATLAWPELRGAVAACRACALCETRRQTVFGVGHTQARWLIVGEAPGEQEDRQGEPFVGAAGQLLDAMLRALGLSRAEDETLPPERRVYIANTLKCRPPHNRNPTPEEMQLCEPFLRRQIELLQPRMVLAMGRFAIQSLLRSNEPVGRLRGRVHRFQGVPLVVTYHPAYLLRSLTEKARAWDDLCLAAQAAEEALTP